MKGKNHLTEHPQVQRLTELMESKNLTKADLAKVANVTPQSVNNWFARGALGKSSALKLSEAYGVSLEWLLGKEVDEQTGLNTQEKRIIDLFSQLPTDEERDRIIMVAELRLKELDEYVEKYLRGRFPGK